MKKICGIIALYYALLKHLIMVVGRLSTALTVDLIRGVTNFESEVIVKKKLTQRVLSFLLAFLMLFGTVFQTQLTFAQENYKEEFLQEQIIVEDEKNGSSNLEDLMDDVIFEEVDNSNTSKQKDDESSVKEESFETDDLEDKSPSNIEANDSDEAEDKSPAKRTTAKDVSDILIGPNFKVFQDGEKSVKLLML